MTLDDLPRDLPRSPTGRVPQWVLDEAAGRPVVTQPWRDPVPPRGARGPAGDRWRRAGAAAFVVLVIALAVTYHLSPSLRSSAGTSGGAVAGGSGDAPPVGHEEQDERLAPAVSDVPADGAHRFLGLQRDPAGDQHPITWSPCRPIHYVVDEAKAPPGFRDEVRSAVAVLAGATGLTFVDDGTTTEEPAGERERFQPDRYGRRWAPVLVRFSDERKDPELDGSVAGYASPRAAVDRFTGELRYVTGQVVIDTAMTSFDGPDGSPAYREVLLHELGHLVGLDHVDDPGQMMHPSAAGRSEFAGGDLAGLAALGRGGCAPGV